MKSYQAIPSQSLYGPSSGPKPFWTVPLISSLEVDQLQGGMHFSELSIQEGAVEGARAAVNGKFVALPSKTKPRMGAIMVASDGPASLQNNA